MQGGRAGMCAQALAGVRGAPCQESFHDPRGCAEGARRALSAADTAVCPQLRQVGAATTIVWWSGGANARSSLDKKRRAVHSPLRACAPWTGVAAAAGVRRRNAPAVSRPAGGLSQSRRPVRCCHQSPRCTQRRCCHGGCILTVEVRQMGHLSLRGGRAWDIWLNTPTIDSLAGRGGS